MTTIGIPTEIMNNEGRVALSPAGARGLVVAGHEVVVQAGAGVLSSFPDTDYQAAGARIVANAEEVFAAAELIVKVKEPQVAELPLLRQDHTLFTYLHLAASESLTRALLQTGATTIAYEAVTDRYGGLPLLVPMSQVAGRLAIQEGAHHLLRNQGGRGVLLSGVPGTGPGKVVVLGGGHVGAGAVAMAHGLRAQVSVLDIDPLVLARFDDLYQGQVHTIASDPAAIEEQLLEADLVIGAVLVAGAKAPTLVSHDLVTLMKPGAVLVDVAIDQGGCFEDSRKTTWDEPTFRVGETIFYCVPNMPGAVANTATRALTAATLPYVRTLADAGAADAFAACPGLRTGLMTTAGQLYSVPVGQAHGIEVAA